MSRTVVIRSGQKGPKGDEGGTSALTTDGDILTRASGVPTRITRAALAADPAFAAVFLPHEITLTEYDADPDTYDDSTLQYVIVEA